MNKHLAKDESNKHLAKDESLTKLHLLRVALTSFLGQ